MRVSLTILLLAAALGAPAWSLAQPTLRAGAAKVDVTPAENAAAAELRRNPRSDLFARHRDRRRNVDGCAHQRRCRRSARRDLAGRDSAARARARHPDRQRPADGDAHAQRSPPGRRPVHGQDRGVGSACEGAPRATLASATAPASRTSTSTATSSIRRRGVGGRGRTTRGLRTRPWPSSRSRIARRADRRLLQLRDARGDGRAARHGQRRCARHRVEVHRGLVRRQRRGALVERRGRRPEPDLFPADLRSCAKSASRTTPSAASTSATRCRRVAKG